MDGGEECQEWKGKEFNELFLKSAESDLIVIPGRFCFLYFLLLYTPLGTWMDTDVGKGKIKDLENTKYELRTEITSLKSQLLYLKYKQSELSDIEKKKGIILN